MTDNEEEDRLKKIQRLLDSEAETHAEPAITQRNDDAPNPEGTTKASTARKTPTPPPHIALDKDNLPLPRRVDEVDMGSTRVSPSAYESASRPRNGISQPRRVPPPSLPISQPAQPWRIDLRSLDLNRSWGCIARIFILTLFGLVILAIIGGSGLLFSFFWWVCGSISRSCATRKASRSLPATSA